MNKHVLSLLTLLLFATPFARAQEVSIGADVVSRYVWRGIDFGESVSIQPGLEVSTGAFTVGTWGSYSLAGDGANEHDLYLSAALGPVSVGVTDYYFPSVDEPDFFNLNNDGEGSHVIEPFVSFDGPVSLLAAANVYNDPDYSVYLEASVPFSIGSYELGAAIGVVPMESAWYLTTGPAITNIAISGSKAVQITSEFALPVSVSYILNPALERTYLVFGISL